MPSTMNANRFAWSPYILRFLRIRNGWSLQETCSKFKSLYPDPELKLAKNQVLNYELGHSIPGADRVAHLAELFGVSPDFFFTKSREELNKKMDGRLEEILANIKDRGQAVPDKPKEARVPKPHVAPTALAEAIPMFDLEEMGDDSTSDGSVTDDEPQV